MAVRSLEYNLYEARILGYQENPPARLERRFRAVDEVPSLAIVITLTSS